MFEKPINYAKLDHRFRRHHERLRARIAAMPRKLTCQACGGAGGEVEPVLDFGQGPWLTCSWCEGLGYVTPWLRGRWLKCQRRERKVAGHG